jgi:hypothetical protein
MGDFSDDYGGYDILGLYEQRDEDRRAQRAKLLALPETPKHAFKAHWEKDGRIGVVAAIVRPDGGVHLLQQFIDSPQRTWVGLTETKIREIWLKGKDHGDDWTDVLALARSFEAELKELNT